MMTNNFRIKLSRNGLSNNFERIGKKHIGRYDLTWVIPLPGLNAENKQTLRMEQQNN